MILKGPVATQLRLSIPDLESHIAFLFGQMSGRDIALKLGVKEDTFYYWLKLLGLHRPKADVNLIAWQAGKWSREVYSEHARTSGFNKASLGRTSPQKGQHLSAEWRDNIAKAQIGRNAGPLSHFWKGGVGAEYYGSGWKLAKRRALRRANGHCQRCRRAVNGKPLHVHHKIPARFFAHIIDSHFDDNLIAVCHPCHHILERQAIARLPLFAYAKPKRNSLNPNQP